MAQEKIVILPYYLFQENHGQLIPDSLFMIKD